MIDLSRSSVTLDPRKWTGGQIAVVGCGSIGAQLGVLLSCMGLARNLVLFDPDLVEPHNLANQPYIVAEIGMPKVDALAGLITRRTAETPEARAVKWTSPTEEFGAVFVCVDSMAERMAVWSSGHMTPQFYADGRISARTVMAMGFDPRDLRQRRDYESTLYESAPSTDVKSMGGCSISSAVMPTATLSASLLAWLFIDHVNDQVKCNECILDLHRWTWMNRRFDHAGGPRP